MMNLCILGTADLTVAPGTVRTGDTETGTETTVPTPGTGRGRERGRGTGSGTGAHGTESGSTTGTVAGVGIERSTGNTMKTGTDIGTETGLSCQINFNST